MVEEWGVAHNHNDFSTQAGELNGLAIPWVYWQIVPGQENDDSSKGDNYEISTGGWLASQGILKQVFNDAGNTPGYQDFSKYLDMSGSGSGSGSGTTSPPATSASEPVGTGTVTPPTCQVVTCTYLGHCYGATCQDDDHCDHDLTCNSGVCGCPSD